MRVFCCLHSSVRVSLWPLNTPIRTRLVWLLPSHILPFQLDDGHQFIAKDPGDLRPLCLGCPNFVGNIRIAFHVTLDPGPTIIWSSQAVETICPCRWTFHRKALSSSVIPSFVVAPRSTSIASGATFRHSSLFFKNATKDTWHSNSTYEGTWPSDVTLCRRLHHAVEETHWTTVRARLVLLTRDDSWRISWTRLSRDLFSESSAWYRISRRHFDIFVF